MAWRNISVDGKDYRWRGASFVVVQGDVPGLDKGSPAFYSWLRQGGAILACIISLNVWPNVPAVALGEETTVEHFKRKKPPIPESIFVFGASPNEDAHLAHVDGLKNLGVYSKTNIDVCFGMRIEDRFRTVIQVAGKPEWSSVRHINLDGDPSSIPVSRSSPAVLQFDPSGDSMKSSWRCLRLDSSRGNANIGPQLAFSGILRPINQSFGNENEPNSYKNQKSFTKLKPDERYFWSLAASILCLGIGWAAWRRIGLVGPLLILYAVAGFVGHFDLFSVLLMLR